jgi:3-deoxy-D-manno-octulosonic-acid transferase
MAVMQPHGGKYSAKNSGKNSGERGLMSGFMLALYSAMMRLAQPLLRRKMARRAEQEPGYGEAVDERFGRYTQPPETASELVWLHAVSLGETRTAAVLLKALRAQHPGLRILLSHGTATGRAEGKALLQPGDVQVWQPWDTHVVVERFFEHFKPRLGLLMETEVWPCAVASAKARDLPLVLVNGRLSDKSLQQALTMSPLAYPAYAALTAVYAQTALDAKRYRQLGVNVAGIFGNLKFDAAPSDSQQATGKAWRAALKQPVVMFASSREGEEDLFLDAIKAVDQQIRVQASPDSIAIKGPVKYLIVPRHPQRFDDVAALVQQQGLTLSRRSSWAGSPVDNEAAMQADIWLGDTLGEMPLYYALSDVALLGGSFEKLGGQNLIEAAACGCPVVMGPHTFNFSDAAELAVAAGAAFRVADMTRALLRAHGLWSDPSAMRTAQSAARDFSLQHRGATEKTCQALAELLRAG